MQSGGFLYLEEFNRTPEDTLNTLLTAMADRRITVPRVGTVVAEPSFRVIASMNPADDIGTTRLSAGIYDRLCRLAVGYQDAQAEEAIVSPRAATELVALPAGLQAKLTSDAVAVTRATRTHNRDRAGQQRARRDRLRAGRHGARRPAGDRGAGRAL
jgi:MoxR-like ATPase